MLHDPVLKQISRRRRWREIKEEIVFYCVVALIFLFGVLAGMVIFAQVFGIGGQ